MFERLKRLYNEGKIDEAGLDAAVEKGWITEEEKIRIMTENTENAEDTEEHEVQE